MYQEGDPAKNLFTSTTTVGSLNTNGFQLYTKNPTGIIPNPYVLIPNSDYYQHHG